MLRNALALFIAGQLVPQAALADCDLKAEGSAGYKTAVSRVTALPEFINWSNTISSKSGANAAFIPAVDKQTKLKNRCYWSVTVYSNEGSHYHRWNTFLISVTGRVILVENIEGEPVPLQTLRSNKLFEPTPVGAAQ